MAMNPRLLRPTASGFNPRQISGLLAWYDASDASTLTIATGVSQWRDKSGNGRTLRQSIGNNQPLSTSRTLNGKTVLDFDGSNDVLSYVDTGGTPIYDIDLATSRSVTFFGVFASDVGNEIRDFLSLQRTGKNSNDSGFYVRRHTNLSGSIEFAAGAGDSTSNDQATKNNVRGFANTSTSAMVVSVTLSASAGQFEAQLNGTTQSLTLRYGTLPNTGFMQEGSGGHTLDIGATRNSGNLLMSTGRWNGFIGEVLIYTTAVSAAQRQRVEGYLAWKWGLQAQLPYDHPYARSFPGFGSQAAPTDSDTLTYLAAVKAADGTGVEMSVANAVDDFVKGCKADGIWDAITASCILAGARTLAGALVPLKGPAPTNNNFVSGDYNRETGLVGNGSDKWLDTNRASNAQGQNSVHAVVYATTANSGTRYYLGDTVSGSSWTNFFVLSTGDIYPYCREATGGGPLSSRHAAGFMGVNRSSSASYVFRGNGQNSTVNQASNAPPSDDFLVFRGSATSGFLANGRFAFYSIGDSLDLAIMDTRVSALITAIGNAI